MIKRIKGTLRNNKLKKWNEDPLFNRTIKTLDVQISLSNEWMNEQRNWNVRTLGKKTLNNGRLTLINDKMVIKGKDNENDYYYHEIPFEDIIFRKTTLNRVFIIDPETLKSFITKEEGEFIIFLTNKKSINLHYKLDN